MNAINKNEVSMFKVGDYVLYEKTRYTYEVVKTEKTNTLALKHSKTGRIYAMPSRVRLKLATQEEIAAGHRIDHFVDANNMVDLETLRDCDTSPNCKKFDERVNSND